MNVLSIGGTRGIGLELIKQAVQDVHEVTVLARHPERLEMHVENLKIIM